MKKRKDVLNDYSYQCKDSIDERQDYVENTKSLNRRQFLAGGTAALLGAGLWFKQGSLFHKSGTQEHVSKNLEAIPGPWPGSVIEVNSTSAITQNTINQEIVGKMLERALKELTGKDSLVEAWSVFIKPEDIVGIKVNCLGGPLCFSSHEVVNEIVRGLVLTGVKEDNIIVWDRRQYHMANCGYKVNRNGSGVKYYGPEIKRVGQEDMNGYDSDAYVESDILGRGIPNVLRKTGKRSYFAKIMSQKITKLINVPVLKDHGSAGITLCLKNLGFGLVNNTARFHPAPYYCAPIMAAVCTHPLTRSKTVLHIVDALNGVWDKGPRARPDYVWHYKSLLVGTDPVALDRIGYEILEAKREKEGASLIGNRALHIASCAQAGLGVNNLSKITHKRITI
jgi:uncharacterized protein (DUF362 family)